MKYIIGLIIGLIMTAFLAYGENLTYTIAQIQALLDSVNAKVSTSAGVADAGKMVVLDATGQVDSTLITGISGYVDISGTPVALDIARFTDANTVEGRSYTEVISDLDLQKKAAEAGSTWDIANSITALSVYTGLVSLDDTAGETTSGASIIGVFDQFTHSDETNIQDVLDDLDAAISSGIDDIVEDTTPQLGGNLDIQAFNIEGVDATEFGYVDGVTSDIQTQLNLKSPIASPTFTGIVTIPIAAAPTTDADGEIAFDTDGWGTGYDALEIWNGTASAYVVATTASSAPTDGQVPKWNTGGTITWQDDGGGGAVDVSGTPVDDDWARFTDADTLEGLSDAELIAALSLEVGVDIQVYDANTTVLGATIGAAEVDADVATQAELETVAALVDTDDEIIAIINASPSTAISAVAGGTGVVNNVASTLTISGNFGTTLTVTEATALTLPASGTVTALGATIGASEVDADVATQAEIDLKANLASPTFTGTVVLPSNQALLGSPTVATSIDPDTSNGAAIGSSTKEWSDLYLADGGIIYGQSDQTNMITSSAIGWTFNIFPITPSAAPDADYEVANKKYIDDAIITAGGGDVTGVADCADGACYDGSADGGTYVRLYDGDSHYVQIAVPDVAGDITITTPAVTSTLLAADGTGASLTAVDAITGDSATAFFDAGTIETNFGGTGADNSATTGIMGLNAGTYVDIDTAAELETYAGLGAFANEYLDDASAAAMNTTLGLGTTDSPRFTGIELSHATENTLTASGGTLSIEGVPILTAEVDPSVDTDDEVIAIINASPSTAIGPAAGGTGVQNNAASTLTISGNFATTLTVTEATALTLPASGTVTALGATIGAAEVDADVATQAEIDLKAPLASPTFTGIITAPIAADPTTDSDGEMSFDTDGWGTGFDALEIWNGTASAYVVATTASDQPTDGQVPKWNTGGEITWEDDGGGGAVDVSGTPVADDIAQFTDADTIKGMTYAELAAIGTFESALEAVLDISDLQGTATVPQGGTGAATFTDGGILLGSGAGAFTALATGTDGQIPIGSTAQADPIMGTIAPNTDVDAITVANGAGTIKLSAHANVEAIADAETGVTDPAITMYDSSAAPGTADIFGTSTGAYDIIMSLWVDVAGTPTEYLQVDGVSETVDVLKPLIAAGIDAGPYFEVGVTSPKTIDTDRCVQYFFSGASNKVYNLPAETECHTIADTNEGYGKMFCFVSTGTGTMEINPHDSDYLFNPTTGAIMAQGESIINSTTPIAGDQVCFFGIDSSDTDRWYPMQQSGDWVEETP